jgi:hypothetical protein
MTVPLMPDGTQSGNDDVTVSFSYIDPTCREHIGWIARYAPSYLTRPATRRGIVAA